VHAVIISFFVLAQVSTRQVHRPIQICKKFWNVLAKLRQDKNKIIQVLRILLLFIDTTTEIHNNSQSLSGSGNTQSSAVSIRKKKKCKLLPAAARIWGEE
jgi:hypothetical protein